MNFATQEPKIRRMTTEDLGRVMEIAAELEHAPHWPLAAYAAALDPDATPRRVCLVVEQAAEKSPSSSNEPGQAFAGAKAHIDSRAVSARLKSCPDTKHLEDADLGSFSAADKAHLGYEAFSARLKSCPDTGLPKQSAALSSSEAQAAPRLQLVVGFAVASWIGSQAELESITVAAAYQRRGLARRLFTALLADFRAAGVTEVLLEVRPSNLPALRLYLALGFVETGRRPGYYADPVEDAVLLTLHLG